MFFRKRKIAHFSHGWHYVKLRQSLQTSVSSQRSRGHNNSHNASAFTSAAAAVVVFNSADARPPACEVTALAGSCVAVQHVGWPGGSLWRRSVFRHFRTWWLSTLTRFLALLCHSFPSYGIKALAVVSAALSKKKHAHSHKMAMICYFNDLFCRVVLMWERSQDVQPWMSPIWGWLTSWPLEE